MLKMNNILVVFLLLLINSTETNCYINSYNSVCSKGSQSISNRASRLARVCAEKKTSEVYANPLTGFLGKFLPTELKKNQKQLVKGNKSVQSIEQIDWNVKKRKKTSLSTLVKNLEKSLSSTEWFVTGLVDPSYFSSDFQFKDPDVQVQGIRDYAYGVNKVFDQQTSRAEIIDIEIIHSNKGNSISSEKVDLLTVTWRLEGKVNVGPGITIKPYIVYTDFTVAQESGLISKQLDRFSIPSYDILLSGLLPFLRPLLTPPAPPAEELRKDRAKLRKY